jgi:chromosome segregation ATPase
MYVEKMKTQLDELNAKMDKLQASAQDAKADAQDKYKQKMAKLRHQSKLAKVKLDELRSAGDDAWEATVAEMDKLSDAFKHSFNYFKSQV